MKYMMIICFCVTYSSLMDYHDHSVKVNCDDKMVIKIRDCCRLNQDSYKCLKSIEQYHLSKHETLLSGVSLWYYCVFFFLCDTRS